MKRALLCSLTAVLVLSLATPAQARFGIGTWLWLSSGGSGWVAGVHNLAGSDQEVPEVVRTVAAGHGVAFDLRWKTWSNPSTMNAVRGCDGSARFDVRYLLETVNGDRDITDQMTGETGFPVRVHGIAAVRIRMAVRVSPDARSGAKLRCRVVSINDRIRPLVVVR